MRDLLLLGLLPFFIYYMAKRPFIGLGMWIWTALFFPNAWVYGIASHLRYNLVFTGVAILSYLTLRKKAKFQLGALGAAVLLFFLWCVVLSVGFYADLEGLKFIASGGGHQIAGHPGHVLGDRNELALAFVMTLPICYYLLGQYSQRSPLLRIGLLGTMALLVVAVVGTGSRGGFVALAGFGAYLFIKSERKIPLAILGALLIGGLSLLVSEDWTARMNGIATADDDSSFMGRVVSWKMSFMLAVKHPFFGGGFKSLEYFPVWADLTRDFYAYPWFYTGDAVPRGGAGRAAHSIYFQVLSEQGFGGLVLFLACLFGAFVKAARLGRKVKRLKGPEWIRVVTTMLQLSIFTYALGGAALSFAYFELFYAIIGLLIVLDARILPAALAAAAVPARPDTRMPASAVALRAHPSRPTL